MTRTPSPLLTAVLAIAIAACASPGGVAAPAAPLPERFSASGAAPAPDRWWRALGDPTLDRLVEAGLAGNPGLAAVWARLDQANAAARAEGASLWPTVSASAGGGGSATEVGTDSSVSLGLAASYEIDLWGGLDAARDAARLDAEASALAVQVAAITLSAEIANTYRRLAEQELQRILLREQEENARRTLEIVELRFERGLVAETDLLRQRQRIESIGGDLALASGRAAALRHALAILVGEAPTASVVPGALTLPEIPPLPATGVPGELVQRRPDVARTLMQLRAADARVAVAISDRFPRLSLGVRLSTAATSPQDLFTGWLASLVGDLVAPLIDGGRRVAQVDRARAALEERVHIYREAVLAALAEVEDALALEATQQAYLGSLDRQIELATGVQDRARAAYEAGATDYLRVLDAELTLQGLQRQRLAASSELLAQRIALYRALAGGFELAPPARA